jgi:hypothetical protein
MGGDSVDFFFKRSKPLRKKNQKNRGRTNHPMASRLLWMHPPALTKEQSEGACPLLSAHVGFCLLLFGIYLFCFVFL